ncbi:hypothetical protein LTR37_017329 [Vermiconidia calcicola]|uniref:Uncharacterized protein n=1 Tax=Vermiconidia calcicola TaxID=1690605 RepID=A0ACC3MKC3_9PEZI|nr:hypothetical protein LTR37_017329 [Vermiconidia calcicola]
MADTPPAAQSVTTTRVFELYQYSAVALTYYDPPKVYGEIRPDGCILVDPILKDISPCLRLLIYEPTSKKRTEAEITLSECAKVHYTICDLKRNGRLSDDARPWADKYGLRLLDLGQSGKKGPQVTYRAVIFKLEGIPTSKLKWTDPLEEMEKGTQEMHYFLTDGHASGDAEIIMPFDANLFLPNTQSFLNACNRVQKEKLAPKETPAANVRFDDADKEGNKSTTKASAPTTPKSKTSGESRKSPNAQTTTEPKEAPKKAAEPKDPKKTKLQHVEDKIVEEMQATYNFLYKDRPSLDDPEFSTKVHDLMNEVSDKTMRVKYLLGQRKALTERAK